MTSSASYRDIPIASARPLPLPGNKQQQNNDDDIFVFQAHHVQDYSNHFYSSDAIQDTIAVSASNVMVAPPTKPQAQQQSQQQQQAAASVYAVTPLPSNNQKPLHPRVAAFKERRKRQQKLAAATGFAVGLILVGPILGVLVGAVAHGTVKATGRATQRRLEKHVSLQQQEQER